MERPIYVGSYDNRRGKHWKAVFTVVILIQAALLAIYLFHAKGTKTKTTDVPLETPEASIPDLTEPARAPQFATASPNKVEAFKLLDRENIARLKSPVMMPGKEHYTIQPGDYLQKIAKSYNITVPLVKAMNGMEGDLIRAGARLMVYRGKFSIQVSKSQNTLDLMDGEKLFKRYSVGTGKFGKTPVLKFVIADKISEPAWTRFSDGKKIEYGDPKNILGTRWMGIKSDDHPEITGFGIHGTWDRESIGKQSSAGCIRMFNEDIEELFDIVPRKTPVTITK